MHALYTLSVWLHILAATAWLGGMFFLVLVLVPWMRRGNRAEGARILRETGTRFRAVGWICFGLFLVTGVFQLAMRGTTLENFVERAWLKSTFGHLAVMKLALFVVIVALSAVHDFVIGPNAVKELAADPNGPNAERLRRRASWMGRVSMLLALIMVYLGVRMVRG